MPGPDASGVYQIDLTLSAGRQPYENKSGIGQQFMLTANDTTYHIIESHGANKIKIRAVTPEPIANVVAITQSSRTGQANQFGDTREDRPNRRKALD